MDKYTEDKEAKFNFFQKEMMKQKEKALNKLSFISKDEDIQEKFAKMILSAESECCMYSGEFVEYFDLDDLDKFAIWDHLDWFTEEYIKVKNIEEMV